MRAGGGEGLDGLARDPLQVRPVDDQQLVQALFPH
jgi:hypothetical protein